MLILFLIVFIDLVGFGIVIPLLPYYGLRFGAAPQTITLLMAVYSLAQFVAAPVWGRLSDRFGRRPILLISLAASSLSYVLLGLAPALWVLFLSRGLSGLMAGNIAAAQAYIADVTTPATRARGMGMIGAAFGLGFIFGPWIGGELAGSGTAPGDFLAPGLAAAALSITAFLATLFALKESLTPEARARLKAEPRLSRLAAARRFLARPALARLILVGFLMVAGFAAMETVFALWARDRFGYGARDCGRLFAFVGIIGALVQGGLIGRLTPRLGEARLLPLGVICLGAGLVLLPFAPALPGLLGAMALLALGFGLANPSLSSLVSKQAGETERGAVMGVFQSASSLARVAGPAVSGPLFVLGHDLPFFAAAMVMAVVAALGLAAGRRRP